MTRRTVDYAADIPERTPAEMLSILVRQLNRDVERIRIMGKDGTQSLPPDDEELFDRTIDRVTKLDRALRAAGGDAELEAMKKELTALNGGVGNP